MKFIEHFLRARERKKLTDPQYGFLYEEHPDELVSFDCETTSLDVKEAEIISIGAVKIRGNRVLTSDSFYVLVKPEGMMEAANVTIHGLRPKDLSDGIPVEEALRRFLHFIGGRPVVGYFLEYDVAMVNKFMKPLLGVKLPNRQIEVSSIYYRQEIDKKFYDSYVDLRMTPMIRKLGIPDLPRHDALNDSINVAMMYLALQARSKR
ncbi:MULTISPECIES: 3'-5' exonuclease [unclassified Neisseria]|uniref:3'-5' exonuclease n=1 Tax=unclassified Neisseria TaxID=2623750 RepID=UPI002665EAD7|nr:MULTISPECIES: 3'-5' exonuclease [unclassified Neisseria]MDO1510057.1 3'-5' exonuclease [Neisseria sp. MVDL19-042950]MDO1516913.1 3'-5' exonuclease [Neisseria sp. MVDL18-041461]MDO1564198.1 3'-5' exonuclease [Neisseria sp. MVDL20-010259]